GLPGEDAPDGRVRQGRLRRTFCRRVGLAKTLRGTPQKRTRRPLSGSDMIQPVILCGGSGTRLWPLSREHYPKQLHALNGEGTLLQQTALRLRGAAGIEADPIVVCNEGHRFMVEAQLLRSGAR